MRRSWWLAYCLGMVMARLLPLRRGVTGMAACTFWSGRSMGVVFGGTISYLRGGVGQVLRTRVGLGWLPVDGRAHS